MPSDPPLLSQEQVERKRAVLTNRAREALSTAAWLGHDVPFIVVLDVRSQQPISLVCAKCGFALVIEQRTHPEEGRSAIHGPASALDCRAVKK